VKTTEKKQRWHTCQTTTHDEKIAVSTATAEDEAKAAKLKQQGFKPITATKAPYRPKEKSIYMEPDYIPPEEDNDWRCLHKNLGNVIHKHKKELPPREGIIHYDEEKHKPPSDRNIQWRDTPIKPKPRITALIKLFWDVLHEVGVSRPVRGFLFHIDTGTVQPFSCKTPWYGAHEARVILALVAQLEAKGWIDDDFGPWGSQIVIWKKRDSQDGHWTFKKIMVCSVGGTTSVPVLHEHSVRGMMEWWYEK
jgi:hypothetical protein